MDPNTQTPQPIQDLPPVEQQPVQQPAQQAAAQPLFSTQAWYSPPSGGRSIFSYKKSNVHVYPGWIVVTSTDTNEEVYRIQLAPDLQMKKTMGQARIKLLGGRKIGGFEKGYVFIFYNPKLMLLSYWFAFAGNKSAQALVDAAQMAANPQYAR